MSGIEVVAAVAAIISAFHGGSELLKHVKAKRRRSRQTQQEFEEKKLQDTLVSGEQQIKLQWEHDLRRFGDLIRVGDVLARDQLHLITIMMQAEIIKALQIAVQSEHAVLNLRILQDASITHKQATFVTLDQLKQRLAPRLPMTRQLQSIPNSSTSGPSFASLEPVGLDTLNKTNLLSDNYIPPAVTFVPHETPERQKHGLSKYLQDLKHKNDMENQPPSDRSRQSKTPADINFSPAYQHFIDMKRKEGRDTVITEIDEIADSFQGLHVNQDSNAPWNNGRASKNGRRDTLAMLNAGDPYPQNALYPTQEATHMPEGLLATHVEYGARGYSQHAALNSRVFEQHHNHQQYPAKNPYPQMQTQDSGSRWSTVSNTSSTYSNTPSLGRNSSTSSQEAPMQAQHHPLRPSPLNISSGTPHNQSPPNRPQFQGNSPPAIASSSASYAPNGNRHDEYIAPQSPQYCTGQSSAPSLASNVTSQSEVTPQMPHDDYNSLMYSPYATPHQYGQPLSQPLSDHSLPYQHHPTMQDQMAGSVPPTRYRYHLMPAVARQELNATSKASAYSASPPISPTATFDSTSAATVLRHGSIAPSFLSTDSGGSNEIGHVRKGRTYRDENIQSGPVDQEKMMNGRAHKANNYWGFCKGAWTIREDVSKGLKLCTQPSGMYNTKEIWECRSCSFKGATFSAPHPTKKNKKITIMDPRVAMSSSGIRYKWIFLAKSHVRKDASNSHLEESNYQCIICSLEDRVSSVYGGVETLMNHIALAHGGQMSDTTIRKANCIQGREARADETGWDINIPKFEQVVELAW